MVSNVNIVLYFDDFLFIGRPDAVDCLLALNKCKERMEYFGIPIAEEKTVIPRNSRQQRGRTIDSGRMEFRLPVDKLLKMKALLEK